MSESGARTQLLKRLAAAGSKSAKAFVAIYTETVAKIGVDAPLASAMSLIERTVEEERFGDAKLIIHAIAGDLGRAKLNSIQLSDLGAQTIQTAIATKDDALFDLSQKTMRHKSGPMFDYLFLTASWFAMKGDKPKMLAAMMRTLKSFGVKPSTFTTAPAFAAYKKDPDFQLAAKGKYIVRATTPGVKAKAAAKKSAKPKHPKGLVVWSRKPSKKVVYDAAKSFFDSLSTGKIDAARAMLEHDEGFDENISALYREMQSIDDALTAKTWKSNLAWLKHVGIGRMSTDGEPFDADESPDFFLPISYKKKSTDVTADFEVRDADADYVLVCTIIHVM